MVAESRPRANRRSALLDRVRADIRALVSEWRRADKVLCETAKHVPIPTSGFEGIEDEERAWLRNKLLDRYYLGMQILLPWVSESLRRDLIELGHVFDTCTQHRAFWNHKWDPLVERVVLLLGAEIANDIKNTDRDHQREQWREPERRTPVALPLAEWARHMPSEKAKSGQLDARTLRVMLDTGRLAGAKLNSRAVYLDLDEIATLIPEDDPIWTEKLDPK